MDKSFIKLQPNTTHSTPRIVKFQSKEVPLKSRDYWGVRKRVSSFQNLLDFWGRKRTNQFSILLDCSIQQQSYLRLIVFDHVCLIRSNLICCRRAPSFVVRIWIFGDSAKRFVLCAGIDFKTKPHAYAKFNRASNVQKCIVCSDRPFI